VLPLVPVPRALPALPDDAEVQEVGMRFFKLASTKCEAIKAELANSNETFRVFEQTAKFLASIKVGSTQAQAIFTKILGGDEKNPSRAAARALALFEGAGIGAELESAKGTAWGALNAVTQLMDWETARTSDARLANAWFGGGVNVKQQTVDALLALS
jgi:hypothetical protein